MGGIKMSLKLMYITNDESIARIAESNDVDWIFVDLEVNGKVERQRHRNTVISKHSVEDVKKIKNALKKSELLVRVNPIYSSSKFEIDTVISNGADIVMLPYFKNEEEVNIFISSVDGRAKTCLLLETPEAVENIDSILKVKGIDYVHIGLNDLYLGYKMNFMFELLCNGIVEKLCIKLKEYKIPFGFGGIAKIGNGILPAEYIISEHYRLGSSMVILSRSFCNSSLVKDKEKINNVFETGVSEIRKYEKEISKYDLEYFNFMHNDMHKIVSGIKDLAVS